MPGCSSKTECCYNELGALPPSSNGGVQPGVLGFRGLAAQLSCAAPLCLHKECLLLIGSVCVADDKNLPNVPPLQLSVPADYPEQSPLWIKNPRQYGRIPAGLFLGAAGGRWQHLGSELFLHFAGYCNCVSLLFLPAANPFLQSVYRYMTSKLLQLPDKHSVTALLNTWAQSIRQACLSAA